MPSGRRSSTLRYALTASGLAGRFKPAWAVSRRSLVAAIGGGLLLGYGARLAYGCNIGAYFSGVASGRQHAPVGDVEE